jgi:hypothetical protein
MTLNRGFTNEGDRIIDYLVRIYASIIHGRRAYIHASQENGIFEAIDKQYLRKVIFGIYLVRSDVLGDSLVLCSV